MFSFRFCVLFHIVCGGTVYDGDMRRKKKKTIKAVPENVRLEKGKNWLAERRYYYMKKLAVDYHRTYRVDLVTAYQELKELGVPYDEEMIEAVRRREQKKAERQLKKEAGNRDEMDDDLFFLTEDLQDTGPQEEIPYDDSDELPF